MVNSLTTIKIIPSDYHYATFNFFIFTFRELVRIWLELNRAVHHNQLSLAWAGGRHARGAAKRTLCTAQMCRGCNTVVIVSNTKLLDNVW